MDMAFTRRSCALGALLFSALVAAVIADRGAMSPPADAPAAAAVAERIDSGHAVLDDYLEDVRATRLAANREADAQLAMSRHQAAAEAALRIADTRGSTGKATPVATAHATATPLPQPSPVAVPQQQVAQVTQEAAPPPAKRPVLARVVSTVTRIPGWVSSNVVDAAAWVVDLPGHVVRLPERRFL
jgi:hypothetical protein